MGKLYSTDSSSAILDNPLELRGYEPEGNSLDERGTSLWENLGGPLEFIGQGTWGFTEALTLGASSIADVAKEEIAKQQIKDGTLDSSKLEGNTRFLEKKVTSFGGLTDDTAGEFGDLSLWGQTGYTLGSILGTIPTFMVGGALTSKAISGVAKVGGAGRKVVASKVSKEIKDAYAKKIATTATDDLGKITFGNTEARAIAEAGLDELGKDGVSASFKAFGNDAFEAAAKSQINNDISAVINLPTKQASLLSDEVFKIITRNNPDNAQRILFGLGAKAFPNSPKIGLVTGAMGYDAILGLTIGAMRGAATESIKAKMQYDTPDMVEETYADRIIAGSLHEAAVLSVIGPVKFIRGGSQQSMLKKTKEAIYGIAKNLTPAKKMSGPQLTATIDMMNTIAGTELTKKIAPKVMKKFEKHRSEGTWWKNKENSKDGRAEMTEWINTARKDFVINAPALWLREFGAEMAYSLPRMAMGTVAMNASGIYEVVKHHGVDNIEMAFGATPAERISNIFTAMYFTRKPHSFYTGDKMLGFETGEIRNNASLKGAMLNKTIGSLKAISSVDIESLNQYAGGAAKNYVDEGFTNHVIENSKELNILRDLSSDHTKAIKVRTGTEDVSDFKEAASKYNVENFGKDPARLESFRKEILRASAILEYYRQASFSKDALLYQTFTKEEAGKIVNDISRLEFAGKTIDHADPFRALNEWHKENIMNSTIDPLNNIYQFVKNSATDILGGGVPEKNGVMDLPRMDKLSLEIGGKKGHDALFAFNTAVTKLETIGKVRRTSEIKPGLDATTDEVRKRVINNYEELNSSLHKWVYGDEYKTSDRDHRYDREISSNYSWYEPFLKIKENDQIASAISVLKGTQGGSIKDADRARLINEIAKVVSGKSKIDLDEAKSSNISPEEFQATLNFTQNLHKYYTDINKKGTDDTKIEYNAAATLKANVEEVLGTVFTNYNSKGRMSTGLLESTLKDVDFSKISTPHDMKVAFRDLLQSQAFSETGEVIVPDLQSFRAKISSLEKTNEITAEGAKEIRDFYSDLMNIVEQTKPNGIIVQNGMSEGGGNKWYDEIKQIKTSAGVHYHNSTKDVVIKVAGGLENVQSKVNLIRLEKEYLLGKEIDGRNDAKIIAEIKESIKVFDESVRDIEDMVFNIKAAHQGTNRHLLHAVVQHESKMSNIIEQISQIEVDGKGRIFEHFKELSSEMGRIEEYAIENGLKESLVIDRVNQEIANIGIPDRDSPNEITRTTISQYSLKYGIKQDDIINLTSLDMTRRKTGEKMRATFEKMQSDIPHLTDAARKRLRDIIDAIPKGDLSTKNFRKGIVEPLFRITLAAAKEKSTRTKKQFDIEDIYADLNTVLTAATSSRPIIEYKYSAGRLIADTKLIGNAKDQERGVSGVIDFLSPGREDVVLLSNSNHSATTGKVVNNFPEYFKKELRTSLDGSKPMVVDSKNALRDAVFNDGTTAKVREGGKYRMVELDESTVVLARVDTQSPIRKKIRYQFGKNGDLRAKIDALGISKNKLLTEFMDIVTNPSKTIKDSHVEHAIKITRAILDAPHIFQKKTAGFLGEALASYDPAGMNKLWKYLKIAEPKNGYIGSAENLARSNAQLEFLKDISGDGSHYDHLYTRAKPWVTPDANGEYKKLKVLSISDETDFNKGTGRDDFRNIFSSRGRAEAILDKKVKDKEITKEQRDYNLELIESQRKSVADGEFIMAESPYVAHLAMQGSGGKKFITFDKNGEVESIRAGGIKPSISYSKVNTTPGKNYGRTRVFYAKTAFKHRPEFEGLLKTLGVDAITFKSANKINQYKKGLKSSWLNDDVDSIDAQTGLQTEQTTYANVRRLRRGVNKDDAELGLNLVDWLSEPGNIIYHGGNKNNHITHLPLSSINMFAVGINHKPMVASSLGVHMQHDNGITEWINLRGRLDQTSQVFDMKRENALYTTALAKKILEGSKEVGDMAFANSGLDQVIKHDGLITDEWMQRAIDERTISYLLNGGAVAGAKVEHGSYDVMSGDFSGIGKSMNDRLAISVRDKLLKADDILENSFMGDRKIVSQFGEFLPSYDFSQQKFKLFGISTDAESKGVGSAIIINTNYQMKNSIRENVDGFMMPDAKNKNHILVVEGVGIDKSGKFIDLNWIENPNQIKTPDKDMKYNKKIYDDFLKIHNEILELHSKNNRGDNFHQMMVKVHEYNKANNTNAAIGALNSRQPRNQAGDIVINRLKSYEEGGKVITSHGAKEGSLSSQNFIDVIHAQDADFDMDKSMVFGASHRKFWSEAGRLAGYESTADANLISDIFTSYVTRTNDVGMGFDWGPDTHKNTMNSIDAARGRFVKMHQTMSYMANIFRSASDASGSNEIMSFTVPESQYKNVRYEIRVNPFNANYINTTEAIGSAVKQFIDMYKYPPDAFNRRINELQYDLYFGDAGGKPSLFQVGKVKNGKFTEVSDFDMRSKVGIKETITENFLQPINKYLTYNKGIALDEASMPRIATLDDYHGAFRNLMFSTNSKYVKSRYGKDNSGISDVNLVNGLEKMSIYFGADGQDAVSRNPYDVAMREIYKIKTSSSSGNELVGNTRAMVRYIETGQAEGKDTVDQTLYKINQKAFSEIVKDDAKIIEYKDLSSIVATLDWQMKQETKRDAKGTVKESPAYKDLQEKRDRAILQKQVIEDALAYKIEPTADFIEIQSKRDSWIPKGGYTNKGERPVVVRDKFDKTKIKEVIAVGRSNFKPIDPKDRMIYNGKRYELVNGDTHLALEVSDNLFNTYNGWLHRDSSGKETFIDPSETAWLRAEVSAYNKSVKDAWNNKIDGTKQSINEYSMQRLDLLNTLFSQERIQSHPAYQEALVAIMMTPGVDRSVITIAPYSSNMGGGAKMGVKFFENKNSKVIYQYLSQLSNSSIKNAPLSHTEADAILKNFTDLKKLGMYSKWNGIDINANMRRSMAKEGDLLTGHIKRDNQVGIKVFEQLRQGNDNAKKAAGLLIDYSNGERMVDSGTMYKASQVLEKAGIRVDRQWISTKYLPSQDRLVGTEKRYYQPIERNRKQNLGEDGNVNQGVSSMIKKSLSCFKGGK